MVDNDGIWPVIAALARWAVGFGVSKLLLAGGIAIAVSSAGLYIWNLKSSAAAAEKKAEQALIDRALALSAADSSFAAYSAVKADADRAAKALSEERRLADEMADKVASLLREIHSADKEITGCVPGNDDPVAAVIDIAIDGSLRGNGPGTEGDNPGRD